MRNSRSIFPRKSVVPRPRSGADEADSTYLVRRPRDQLTGGLLSEYISGLVDSCQEIGRIRLAIRKLRLHQLEATYDDDVGETCEIVSGNVMEGTCAAM